jgi:ribosome-binding protein aMBF1 (putative translation factor)
MKMSTCDLCGNHTKDELKELRKEYQISEVTHLCCSCAKWADKTKSDLLDVVPQKMKEAIHIKKHGEKEKKRFSFWGFSI